MGQTVAAPPPAGFICLGKEIVISHSAEIVSCRTSAAKALTVTDLLDVAQAACHTLVSITVERIEVQRYTGIAAGVYFIAVKDRLHILVHNLRRSRAVGIDEVVTLVGLIITLGITVTQRKLDRCLVRLLAAELGNTLFDCGIDSLIDSLHRFGVRLRDKYGNGVSLRSVVDAGRFPAVEIRETSVYTCDNLCRRNSNDINPPV